MENTKICHPGMESRGKGSGAVGWGQAAGPQVPQLPPALPKPHTGLKLPVGNAPGGWHLLDTSGGAQLREDPR